MAAGGHPSRSSVACLAVERLISVDIDNRRFAKMIVTSEHAAFWANNRRATNADNQLQRPQRARNGRTRCRSHGCFAPVSRRKVLVQKFRSWPAAEVCVQVEARCVVGDAGVFLIAMLQAELGRLPLEGRRAGGCPGLGFRVRFKWEDASPSLVGCARHDVCIANKR